MPRPLGNKVMIFDTGNNFNLVFRRASLTALIFTAIASSALASPPKQILDTLPDFSYAGYRFGNELETNQGVRKIIAVDTFGAIANDTKDDSAAFLKALQAAHQSTEPVTVQLGAGRYIVSEILQISRSDIRFQGLGAGEGGTELYFPRPLRLVNTGQRFAEIEKYLRSENKMQVEPDNNLNLPFTPYSWTGGFIWVQAPNSRPFDYLPEFDPAKVESFTSSNGKRGELSVVANGSNFRAGDTVRIQWRNAQGEKGKLIDEIYGTQREQLISPVGSRMFEDAQRALVSQITIIRAVKKTGGGQLLQLADPLLHPVNAQLPATIGAWTGVSGVVIRDFAIRFPAGTTAAHHLEDGYNGIYLSDAINAWIDSIRVIDADSAVLTYNSVASTIANVITEGTRKAHYSVHLGNVHGILVRDLTVLNPTVHALSFNTFCTRSVYQRATVWNQGVIDQHAGVNQQNLVDQALFYVHSKSNADGVPSYPLWDGSGAGYWQPGHGRYNTHWNVRVMVLSGANSDQEVLLTGLDEGPDARIVGLHGNRNFKLWYRPQPFVDQLNGVARMPSLYDWQRQQRQAR